MDLILKEVPSTGRNTILYVYQYCFDSFFEYWCFFVFVMLLKLMMSLSPKSSSDVALCSSNFLYPFLSSAALSMLPWPKPAVWPSVPPDASSEVFLKEKMRVISSYYWMHAYKCGHQRKLNEPTLKTVVSRIPYLIFCFVVNELTFCFLRMNLN